MVLWVSLFGSGFCSWAHCSWPLSLGSLVLGFDSGFSNFEYRLVVMVHGSLASGGDTDIGIGISIGVGFLLS